MIKKLLYLSILLMLNMTVAYSQDLTVTPSDTVSIDTTTGCQTQSTLVYRVANASSTDTLQMNWHVVYNTFPHGWTVAFCDPDVCLSSTQIGSHTFHFTLYPSGSGLMQLDLTPTSGTACGQYQVFTWATNDSARTATYLTYKACITAPDCANGINEPEVAKIALYPNPVRSEVKVILPQYLSNGQLDIYDVIGSKVYSQSISTTEDIDLSALETGIYMARISDGGKIIATRKFTKQN